MKYLFLIILLCNFNLPLTGQVITYHVSGNVYLKEHGQSEQLLPEQEINKGDRVIIQEKSQAVFFNQYGQHVSLHTPDTYNYKEILDRLADTEVDLTEAYFKYLWKRLNKKKKKGYQQANSPIAGVARGDRLRVISPADSAVILQDKAVFAWQGNDTSYRFTLADEKGKHLLQLETPSSTFTLNFAESKLPRNKEYHWWIEEINTSNSKTGTITFILPDQELQAELKEELNNINAVVYDSISDSTADFKAAYVRTLAIEKIGNR